MVCQGLHLKFDCGYKPIFESNLAALLVKDAKFTKELNQYFREIY